MRMKLAIVALSAFAAVPAMAQTYPYNPYRTYPAPYWTPPYQPAPTYVPPSSYAPAMTHREMVNEIQDELEEHGYRPGPYDGVLDAETVAAIRSYQRDAGLPVTGEATPALLDHLRYTSPPVQARGVPAYPPTYVQPQYGQPQYQPQYGQPQYGQPQYGPQYSQPQRFDSQQAYPEGQAYPQGQGTTYTQPATVPPPNTAPPPPAYAPPLYSTQPEALAPPQYSARPEPARRGDPDVAWVQDALQRKGYSPGPADGVMGQRTRRAIEAFQRDNGLPVDGNVGPTLLTRLR